MLIMLTLMMKMTLMMLMTLMAEESILAYFYMVAMVSVCVEGGNSFARKSRSLREHSSMYVPRTPLGGTIG